MTSIATTPNPNSNDLAVQLQHIGLRSIADSLDDFLARAIKSQWPPPMLLEELARIESHDRAQRSLERRLQCSRIGRLKPMADFDWNWPKKIDRDTIGRAFTLDFIPEGRNLILIGANGLGKTMIAKNIAHAAVLAGYSVLFRTASELLDDLQCDSPHRLRQKLKAYARPALLCIDECGYRPTTITLLTCSTKSSTAVMNNGRFSSPPIAASPNGTKSFPTPPVSPPYWTGSPIMPTSRSLKDKAIASMKVSRRRNAVGRKRNDPRPWNLLQQSAGSLLPAA